MTVVIVTVVTVAVVTVVIVTYFSKNNLIPQQPMRCSQVSFSRFTRCLSFATSDQSLTSYLPTVPTFAFADPGALQQGPVSEDEVTPVHLCSPVHLCLHLYNLTILYSSVHLYSVHPTAVLLSRPFFACFFVILSVFW